MTMSTHHRIGAIAILVTVAALVGCRRSEQSADIQVSSSSGSGSTFTAALPKGGR